MKIIDYEYLSSTWKMSKVNLQNFNLIIGDSAAGKTRLLNTLFNLGRLVAQKKIGAEGNWKITLQIGRNIYFWEVNFETEENVSFVQNELVTMNEKVILTRNKDETIYLDTKLHKLPQDETSISLLREEEIIKPLFQGFSTMLRRKFFSNELEKHSAIYAVNTKILDELGQKNDLFEVYKQDLGLNPRLYVLSNYFPDIYKKIIDYFRDTFEFISDIKILDSSDIVSLGVPAGSPVICIKESNVDDWIPLTELSSGMQKTLLILTDLVSLPKGTIYLLDEYENSLGIGPVDVLPDFMLAENLEIQLIVTSHLPHIISKVPVENWYIAHRKGSHIDFAYGDDLVAKYSISAQEKYIQLLNDPLYNEGIE